MLSVKFHSQPVYEEKYTKTKVKIFNQVVNTLFSDDKVPSLHLFNSNMYWFCHLQVYLEQCKF